MGGSNGGTNKWCPNCMEITICAAISPKDVSDNASRNQRIFWDKHRDLNAFRRGISCLACHESWLTVEMEESFMDELIHLREKLTELKLHASEYQKESQKAANSLKKLTESISLLKALS
jgi:hypothetical protein